MKKSSILIVLTLCVALITGMLLVSCNAKDDSNTVVSNVSNSTVLTDDVQASTILASFIGGGIEGDPYIVDSAEKLLAIPTVGLDKHYLQTCDINLSGVSYTPIGARIAVDNTDGIPEMTGAFSGVYDGGNYEIKNLTLNSSSHCEALFASNTGTIKNVSLRNASIKGSYYVAGIVGLNNGRVINCINYGSTIKSLGSAGGITGATWNGSIEKCMNFASVTKVSDSEDSATYTAWNTHWYAGLPSTNNHPVGGLTSVLTKTTTGTTIGTNAGTITESANYGAVVSAKIGHAAGIAGAANGTISYCINGGNVSNTGSDRAALIVCNTLTGLTISNTYNYGTCSCSYNEYTNDSFVNFGDLANNSSNKVSASTFGSTNYANASDAISGYANNSKFVIDPQVNNGYPYLANTQYGKIYGVRGLENGSVTNGYNNTSGTAISSKEQFLSILRPWATGGETILSGNYYLTADIDMSGWDSSMYDNNGDGIRESFWTSSSNYPNYTKLTGTIDGNGHTITFNPATPSLDIFNPTGTGKAKVYACVGNRKYSGFLVDRISDNGTIKNLNIVFKGNYVGQVNGNDGSRYVGGVVGEMGENAKILNCSVTYEEGSYYECYSWCQSYTAFGGVAGSVWDSAKIIDTTVVMNGSLVADYYGSNKANVGIVIGFALPGSSYTILERCSVYSDTTNAKVISKAAENYESFASAVIGHLYYSYNLTMTDFTYGYIGTISSTVMGSSSSSNSIVGAFVAKNEGTLTITKLHDLSRSYSNNTSYATGSARYSNGNGTINISSTSHYFRPLLLNSPTSISYNQNNARIARILLDPTNPSAVYMKSYFAPSIPNGYYALAQVTADDTTPYSGPSATADGLILIGDNAALTDNGNYIYLKPHKENAANIYATIRIGTKAKISVNNTSFTSGDNKTYGDLANELMNATPSGTLSSGNGYWTGTTNMVQSLGSNARVRIYDHNMAIAYESWNSSYASSTVVLEPGTYYAKYATSLSPMGISMLSVPAISLSTSSTNNVNSQFYIYLEDENTITFHIVERDLVNGSVVDGYNSTKGTAISSWNDFLSFRQYVVGGTYGWANVTGNYYLTQDIVAPEGWDYFEGYTSSGWDGADNSPKAINFSGIFDGNGHTITFSPISDNGTDYTYAFGYSRDQVGYIVDKLSGTGTIKNLNVVFTGATNYKFKTTSDYGYQCAFGGIVGIMQDNSRINNCTVTYESGSYIEMRTDASPTNHNNYNMLGGMVGRMGGTDDSSSTSAKNNPITSGNIQIIDSTVTIDGTLKHTQSNNATDWLAVGGFAGQACASSSQLFTRCSLYGTGSIEGACKSDKGANVAGFIGEIKHGNSSETVAHTAIDLVYGFQGSINSTGASTSSYNRKYCITTLQGGATLDIDRVFYFDTGRSYTNGSNVNLGSEPSYAWGISTISSKVQIFRAIVPNSTDAVTLNASNAYLDRVYFTPGLEQEVVVRATFNASIPDNNHAFIHGSYINNSSNHVGVFSTNADGGVDGLKYLGTNSDIGSGVEFTIPFANYSGKAIYAVARINQPSTFAVSGTDLTYSADTTANTLINALRNNNSSTLSSALGYWLNTHTSISNLSTASIEVLDNNKNVIYDSLSGASDVRLNAGTYYARYRTTLTNSLPFVALNVPSSAASYSSGSATPIGIYLDDDNYIEFTVAEKDISLTIDNKTSVYGDSIVTLTATYDASEVISGDVLNYTLTTTATSTSDAIDYDIIGTDNDSNYNIIFTNGTYTITKRTLTVNIGDTSSTYGDSIAELPHSITAGNIVNDDPNVYSVSKLGTLNAGTHDIVGTINNDNYDITFVGSNGDKGVYTIDKKQISVTIDAKTAHYGEAQVELTYSVADGTMEYGEDKDDVLDIVLSCSVDNSTTTGTYNISCNSATADNYDISVNSSTYTVTKRPLTVNIGNASSTYGDSIAELPHSITAGNIVNDDPNVYSISKLGTLNAGPHDIVGTVNNDNYDITFVGSNGDKGVYTIEKRAITVTINDNSSVYGDDIPTLTSNVTTGSIVNNESVYTLAKADGVTPGTYAITGTQINDNYIVTFTNTTGTSEQATFTISKREVSVNLGSYTSVYGDTIKALAPTVVAGSIADGENISLLDIAYNGVAIKDVGTYDLVSGATYDNDNYDVTFTAGSYEVTPRVVYLNFNSYEIFYGDTPWTIPTDCYTESNGSPNTLLDGEFAPGIILSREEGDVANTAANPSYDINFTYTNTNYTITVLEHGTLTIKRKAITLYINDVTTTYGDAVVTEFTFSDNDNAIIDGDQDKISPYYSTNISGERPNSDTYEISAYSLNTNYTITFEKGAYVINPKAITVTIDDKASVYGDDIEVLTSNEASVVLAGDSLGLTLTANVDNTSTYGTYDITASSTNTNYVVTFNGTNGNKGVYTVNKRPLTVNIGNASSIYGEELVALPHSITAGNIVNGDPNVYSVSKLDGVAATTYDIVGTVNNDNYDVTFVGANGDKGVYTIEKRAISIIINDLESFYGDELDTNFSYTDVDNKLVYGDSLNVVYSTTIPSVDYPNAETYDIEATANNDNYDISITFGKYTIKPREIEITINNQDSKVGEAIKELTYNDVPTVGTIVNNDELGITLSTTATSTSPKGEYPITGSWNNDNYNVTFVKGTYFITQSLITITIDSKSQIYGEAEKALTYSVSGDFADGDDESIFGITINRATGSTVGTYAITVDYIENDSYSVAVNSANYVITARKLTITADNQSSVYGDAIKTLTYSVTATNEADNLTGSLICTNDDLSIMPITSASRYSKAQEYEITISANNLNGNYDITTVSGTYTINKRPVYVVANYVEQVFGNPQIALDYTATGLVNGNSLSGSLVRDAGDTVGTYEIKQGTLAHENYDINYTSNNYVIVAREITVTPIAETLVYGDAPITALRCSVSAGANANGDALVDGYPLEGALTRENPDIHNAGTYLILQGTLDNNDGRNSNYAITFVSGITYFIDKKASEITPNGATLVDGEYQITTTYSNSVYEVTGTLSHTEDGATVTTTSTGDNKNSTLNGTFYLITLSATETTNYYAPASVEIKLFINPYDIGSVSADALDSSVLTKVYGDVDPEFKGTVAGINENFEVEFTRNAGETVNAIGYSFNSVTSLNSNYVITLSTSDVRFRITKRDFFVTPSVFEYEYGAEKINEVYYDIVSTGFNNDSFNVVYTHEDITGVGSFDITGISNTNPNYNLFLAVDSGIGKIIITERKLYVTANDVPVIFGESASLTFKVEGLLPSDTIDSVFSGSLEREAGTDVGTYAITIGTLQTNDKYKIESFTGANYIISVRDITITPTGFTKEYGAEDGIISYEITTGALVVGVPNATLTGTLAREEGNGIGEYAITIGTLANSNYNITLEEGFCYIEPKAVIVTPDQNQGHVYGESDKVITYTTTALAYSETTLLGTLSRVSGKSVGEYAITIGDMDTANANYTVTLAETTVYYTITPRSIKVIAKDSYRYYGDADGTFAYDVEGTLLDGDYFTGKLERISGENVETYIITRGTLEIANYEIEFVPGKYEIRPRPIEITIGNQSSILNEEIVVDQDNYRVTMGKVLRGDDLGIVIVKADGTSAGYYELTGEYSNPNYEVTFINGTFHIYGEVARFEVPYYEFKFVYTGNAFVIPVTVTSGAPIEFYVDGSLTENSFVTPGVYEVTMTSQATEEFAAPNPITVTVIICDTVLKEDTKDFTVIIESANGFDPETNLVLEAITSSSETGTEIRGIIGSHERVKSGYNISIDGIDVLDEDATLTIKVDEKLIDENGKVKVVIKAAGEYHIAELEVIDGTIHLENAADVESIGFIEVYTGGYVKIVLIILALAIIFLIIVPAFLFPISRKKKKPIRFAF